MQATRAFITGASSGIGAAVAKKLAARGVEVALAARREDELQKVRQEIEAAGGKARVYPLDVTHAQEVIATVRRADEEMGGVDLVIANAGVGRARWAGKLDWDKDVKPLIDVNVTGAAATLVALLPRMAERKKGHLVGVSSLAGYHGLPRSATYSATKAFLSVFLEGLRPDLHSVGVAVTDVRPGFVKTALTAKNDHKMPFLLELEDAAETIVRGIARRARVVAFPLPLAAGARMLRLVPGPIFDRVAGRRR